MTKDEESHEPTKPISEETPFLARACDVVASILGATCLLVLYSQVFYEDGRAMSSATTWTEVGLRLLIIAIPGGLAGILFYTGVVIRERAKRTTGGNQLTWPLRFCSCSDHLASCTDIFCSLARPQMRSARNEYHEHQADRDSPFDQATGHPFGIS